MVKNLIIIGAGQAGVQIAAGLRSQGYQEKIICITKEKTLPYYRPPLSKAYLSGELEPEKLPIRPESFYRDQQIELRYEEVVEINLHNKTIKTESDSAIPYSKLVLATGAKAARLPLKTADLKNIYTLRELADADRLKAKLDEIDRLIIIGGGFIGLEVASSLAKIGIETIVIEAEKRIMARAVSPILSDYFQKLHRSNGVKIITNMQVKDFLPNHDNTVGAVLLQDGQKITAPLVLMAVGAKPNIDLAQRAGIKTQQAIVLDQYCRTDAPDVFAAGDCTWQFNRFADQYCRLESIQNATDQARTIARSIIGKPTIHDYVPWFWSDQLGKRLQIAGMNKNQTTVTRYVRRKEKKSDGFSVFQYAKEKLIAVESIDNPAHHMFARKALSKNISPDPQKIEDNSVNLAKLLA